MLYAVGSAAAAWFVARAGLGLSASLAFIVMMAVLAGAAILFRHL